MAIDVSEFLTLRKQHVVVDVRSESEFAEGHIPGAVNIPLLNDSERVVVGTTYKQKGQQQAINEGFKLVGPRLHEIVERTREIADGKEILVHCWRGGMRSNNFCAFAAMAGVRTKSLQGGYKAYRHEALLSFDRPLSLLVLAGRTGTGKSEMLRELAKQGEQVIDLEQLASHRGSAFGGLLLPPQPTTEQFQNDLFDHILGLDPDRRTWIEDESLAVGKIFLPTALWKRMQISPVVEVDVSLPVRINRLALEYGPADRNTFLEIMQKVTKKLGGQNFNAARDKLLAGDFAGTLEILLSVYYDKAYRQSIQKRDSLVVARVSWDGNDLPAWIKQLRQLKINNTQTA